MWSDSYLYSWLSMVFFGGTCVSLTAIFLLYHFQEKLLYFPTVPNLPKSPENNPEGYRSPEEYNVNYENVYFTTVDKVKIHGWLLKQPHSKEVPTLLFFHGNAGNIGFRLPNAMEMFKRLNCNIFMVDYRGYGNSQGVPSEIGLHKDAEAALQILLLRNDINPYSIFVFGRSLGGAVALSLVETFPDRIAGVILENTFLSISSMVDSLMPFLKPLKGLVLRMKWSNDQRIRHVKNPILFLAGEKDELVPPFHMQQLFKEAVQCVEKQWHSVPNGTHNDTWLRGGEMYYLALQQFIDKISNRKSTIPNDNNKFQEETTSKKYIPSMLDQPLLSSLRESRESREL